MLLSRRIHRHWLHSLQRVHVILFVGDVQDEVDVVFIKALLLYDILDLEYVHAHVCALLNQFLFAYSLKLFHLLIRIHLRPKRQFGSNDLPLLLLSWPWVNSFLLEEGSQLARNFLECLLGKSVVVSPELTKWNELDDISTHVPLVLLRVQRFFIGIQHIHWGEVSISNANNDNGQRKVRASHNLVYGLLEVANDTISDDQQDLIGLVVSWDFRSLASIVGQRNDVWEVRWAVELKLFNAIFIAIDNLIDTVAFRVEDVSIQSQAVRCRGLWGNSRSESVRWNLFVWVIVLQNISHSSDGLDVFVSLVVLAVQWVMLPWVSVR